MSTPTIDLLLNLVPERPDAVLAHLRLHPALAPVRDAHGYSLLHAAVSYDHPDLLRALVTEFGVDPNLVDEDDETCLFNAETVAMAELCVELGVDVGRKNGEGMSAAEKLRGEDEVPEVGEYLLGLGGREGTRDEKVNGSGAERPPRLPDGLKVEVGTMLPEESGEAPDPEIRRRIEELAARGDFEGEEGQRELRNLVQDVVLGMKEEEEGGSDRARRRVE